MLHADSSSKMIKPALGLKVQVMKPALGVTDLANNDADTHTLRSRQIAIRLQYFALAAFWP